MPRAEVYIEKRIAYTCVYAGKRWRSQIAEGKGLYIDKRIQRRPKAYMYVCSADCRLPKGGVYIDDGYSVSPIHVCMQVVQCRLQIAEGRGVSRQTDTA